MNRRSAWFLTLLSIAILVVVPIALAVALSSCTAANGKHRTAGQVVAEVWKLTRNAAYAACTVVERPETATLATVVIPDYGPLGVALARLACSLITARPDAIGVVVSADGTGAAITMPRASGGESLPVQSTYPR